MKKLLLTAIIALSMTTIVSAQYCSLTFDTKCNSKIVQIDQFEESTLVFFTYKSDEDETYARINDDDLTVKVPGSLKKYKVKTVAGIGLESDNSDSYARKAGDELNYVIEFEKFPIDKPFEIIEGDDDANDFNFRNITVNTELHGEMMPVDDFLAYATMPLTGIYYDEGSHLKYWSENGLVITVHFVTSNEYGNLFKIYLEVVNNTGRTVDLITNKIAVTAENTKNGKITEVPLLSFNDFDTKVVNNLGWYSSPTSRASDELRWMSRRSSNNDDTGAAIAFGALSILASAADAQNYENYTRAVNQEREEAVSNYLKSNTLQPGATYGGFVAVKDRKPDKYHVTVTIAKKEYKWTCDYHK